MYLTTWAACNFQSTSWHSKIAYKNHTVWAKKSPDLELTTHQGWQTIQEADDDSLPIPLTKLTQQSPGTQRETKSLSSSLQPVLCLYSIWHKLLSPQTPGLFDLPDSYVP